MNDRRTDKNYAAGDIPWLYPHRDAPPRGVKLNLLQDGGCAIHGQWKDNEGLVAWQYLFRRDKEQEEEAKALAMEEIMLPDEPIARFRVPVSLPKLVCTWRRATHVRWLDDDGKEVAAIYKLIDADGYVTPISWQYDRREQPVFDSGYCIVNTTHVFKYWSDLVAFWPTYLEELNKRNEHGT